MALDIVITNVGRAAIVNAMNNGTDTVLLTHVAFGTGQYNASSSRQQLQNEVKRVDTISGQNISNDTIHVTARDESIDEYDVGEVGVFTDDGVLFAVYSSADSLILQKTASSTLLMAIDIVLRDLDANVVSFGDTNFTLPPASTTVQGVVERATDAEALAGTAEKYLDARAAHLAFGQYGLGTETSTPPGNNLNVTDNSVPSGMYQVQPGTTGNPISTSGNVLWMRRNAGGGEAQLLFSESGGRMLYRTRVSGGWTSWREVWHDQNMGSGSGLDADELDGQHGSYYRNAGNMNAGTLPAARLPSATATTKGAVELATAREAREGASNDLAVTPAGLRGVLEVLFPIGSVMMRPGNPGASIDSGGLGFGGWERVSGRHLIGSGQGTDTSGRKITFTVGDIGGIYRQKLGVDEMPRHRHTGTTDSDTHSHKTDWPMGAEGDSGNWMTQGDSGRYDGQFTRRTESDAHSHAFTTSYEGDGDEFDVTSPFLVVDIWRRIS